MAIAVRATGTPTGTAELVTNIAPAVPAGWQPGDRSFLLVGLKPDTSTCATPSGWTLDSSHTGGSGVQGADTGATKSIVFYRDDPPVAPGILDIQGASAAAAVIHIVSRSSGKKWEVIARSTAVDAVQNANYFALGGAVINLVANDKLLAHETFSSDGGVISAEAFLATGATLGAFTVLSDRPVSTGDDLRARAIFIPVTAGPPSGEPQQGYTNAQGGVGHTAFIRLREIDYPAKAVSQSLVDYERLWLEDKGYVTQKTLRDKEMAFLLAQSGAGTAKTFNDLQKVLGKPIRENLLPSDW